MSTDETSVSPELIHRQSEELQGLRHDDARAKELAAEVQRLNSRVRQEAEILEFDDEPLAFQARMQALARQPGQGVEDGPGDDAAASDPASPPAR